MKKGYRDAHDRLHMLGYLRVSTGAQARSGLGEAAQRAKIEAAAAYNDWEIVEWLVDAGETAKDMDRPEFVRALQMVAEHQVDGIAIAKLDRVARNVADFSQLLNWFVSAGKTLAILDPAVDTSTPNGRLVAHILSGVAEWEASIIAARTSDALQAKRASGLPICRPSVADDGELVTRIRDLREEGNSYQKIADALNAAGVPTLRGGTEWRVSAVQHALGYRRPPKKHKPADLPQIKRRSRWAAA
jgi:DNA invertase Pin-like site-specific DNA recombinase